MSKETNSSGFAIDSLVHRDVLKETHALGLIGGIANLIGWRTRPTSAQHKMKDVFAVPNSGMALAAAATTSQQPALPYVRVRDFEEA